MDTNTIRSRFFLVGCGRSGTTLLQSMLASHSQIASMPETWFFVAIAGYLTPRLYGFPPTGARDRLVRIRDEVRLRLGMTARHGREGVHHFLREICREDLMSLFPPTGRRLGPQLQACVHILDRMAQEQNRPIWLEKSPLHLGYIDLIERTIPQARFIHLVRDGTDVVASLYDATLRYEEPWRRIYPTLDRCIDQWNHCIRLSSKYLSGSRHTLVHYEDLVADAETTLRRLCPFIEVEFEAGMLQGYAQTSTRLTREQEKWKSNVADKIHNANGVKFRTLFTEEQRSYIQSRLIALPANLNSRQGSEFLYRDRLKGQYNGPTLPISSRESGDDEPNAS